jgi:hypothetical protein
MANTLKFGNGEWYGKKDTILAYNDENSNYKPLPFDFDRGSTATRINRDGLIETVGTDEPRVDYLNNSKGALLLEPSRTNLVPYSENFNSGWSQYGSPTINISSIISPDGTLNGSNITRGSNATPLRYQSLTSTGTQYTFSLYAKKGSVDKIYLDIGDVADVEFTLTDEWQRFEITQTPTNFTHIDISFGTSTSGDNFYIYGAQLEAGSYATSYIPTQGSAVTRLADVCNNGGNEQVFNDSEGVLMAEFSVFDVAANSKAISIYKTSSPTSNAVILYYNANRIAFDILNPSGTVSVLTDISVAKELNKVAIKYKSGDIALWFNGLELVTRTNTLSLSGLDKLEFDFVSNNDFYGKIKDIRYYNTALSDSELRALTT